MVPSFAYILAIVFLLLTPTFSAPIHTYTTHIDARQQAASMVEKRSPMYWGHHYLHSPPSQRDQHGKRNPSDAYETHFLAKRTGAGLRMRDIGDEMEDIHRRGLWDKVKGAVKQTAGKAVSAAKQTVQKATNTVRKTATKAVSTVKKTVQKAASTVKKTVHKATSAAKKVVHKAASTVKKGVSKVKKAANKVTSKVRKVANKVTNKVKNVASKVKKGVRKVTSTVKKAANRVTSKVKKVANKVKSKVNGAVKKVKSKVNGVARKVKSKVTGAVNKVKSKVKGAVNKVTKKVKNTVSRVKKTANNIKNGVKKATQATTRFLKEKGPTIAKVGLKFVAASTKLASHAVALVPGAGKVVGKGLSGVSAVADFAGDQIHVDLSPNLDKTMAVLDKVQHPLSGTAGKILDTVLKREMEEEELLRRGLEGSEDLYVRDNWDLEARSYGFDEDLEKRSFDDVELEARYSDEDIELEARAIEEWVALHARDFDEEGTHLKVRSLTFAKDP